MAPADGLNVECEEGEGQGFGLRHYKNGVALDNMGKTGRRAGLREDSPVLFLPIK